MRPISFAPVAQVRQIKFAGAPTPAALFTPAALLAAAALLSACASLPPPVEQMAVTRTTVERVSSAPNAVDAAPVEMSQAREKLARAERAMNDKDYVTARRLGAEAEADARVAESRASAMRGERALKEIRDSIRSLQDEINRRAP